MHSEVEQYFQGWEIIQDGWAKNQQENFKKILETKKRMWHWFLVQISNILRCLLVTEEFDSWVGDNPSTIGTISFKQSTETLSSPDICQAL